MTCQFTHFPKMGTPKIGPLLGLVDRQGFSSTKLTITQTETVFSCRSRVDEMNAFVWMRVKLYGNLSIRTLTYAPCGIVELDARNKRQVAAARGARHSETLRMAERAQSWTKSEMADDIPTGLTPEHEEKNLSIIQRCFPNTSDWFVRKRTEDAPRSLQRIWIRSMATC
jgi:hypothetical protein